MRYIFLINVKVELSTSVGILFSPLDLEAYCVYSVSRYVLVRYLYFVSRTYSNLADYIFREAMMDQKIL